MTDIKPDERVYFPLKSQLSWSILLICLVSKTSSARYLPWRFGQCLDPEPVDNFNATEFFSGRWYQLKSFGNYLFQGEGTCPTLISRITENGEIIVKTYNYNPRLKLYMALEGTSDMKYITQGLGYLPITFLGLGFLPVKVPFTIIATDYNNWAVVYACQQRILFKSEMSFVLTRNRGSNEHNPQVTETILSSGLNINDYVPSVNMGCGPNEPIV